MQNPTLFQVTEVTIQYKSKIRQEDRPKISNSRDAENIFRNNWSQDIEMLEEVNVLFLNKANDVTGFYRLARGGVSGCVIDVKLVFAAALKHMAAAIIIAHNHPSGSLLPSRADLEITSKLKSAGEILDCPVLDHVILAPGTGYYSFADNNNII